jgi:phosphohistidine swiveling domain-containing protein
MGRYVSSLGEIGLADLAQVGGKGAHLGEMMGAGFSVPPGFSVKSEGYDRFFDAAGLKKLIEEIAAQIDFRDLKNVEEKTARIRDIISTARIPEDVETEVREAYEALREGEAEIPLVAVRSSVGTRDLSRSSFPGQMDTFHNVLGIEEVLATIRKCWASVWSARAASMMHALQIDPDMIIIAPVVQRMVPSEVSGVLFTANPVHGDSEEMLMDAAFGLGEAVVSGVLTPDHYVISKKGLRVLSKEVGCKPFKLELDVEKGTGNRRVVLPDEEANSECLAPDQVRELAELGLAVEEHFGIPQDIEWAYSKGKLFLLQSRKIAGLDRAASEAEPEEMVSEFDTPIKDPPDIYSSANISEVMPGVLTPLSLDAVKSCDYAFWKINHDVGLIDEPFPEGGQDLMFIGLFQGRLHLNISTFSRIMSKIPGASAQDTDRAIPVDERFVQSGDAKVSLRMVPFLVSVVAKALRLRRRAPKDLERLTSRLNGRIAETRSRDFSRMDLEDFAELLDLKSREGREIITLHILNSQLSPAYYGALRKLARNWLGDEIGAFSARLVTGLATMESARPTVGIYRLYRFVADSPGLTGLFRESETREILPRIESSQEAEAEEFRGRLDAFLKEHGYRAVAEAEMMAPSWDEDPTFVLAMIKNYLRAERVEDPADIEVRQRKDREAATEEALAGLGIGKKGIFKWVLKEACTFLAARENGKALTILGLHDLKKTLRALSRRLSEKGMLEDPDDIYFLSMEELIAYCRGGKIDVSSLIPRRKQEYERDRKLTLPETFSGRPVPIQQDEELPETRVLKGLPVSPGRVTGPARVIMDPREDAHLEEGEILVAPVTDTGWTPLFILAKGLVVDIGGLLSHGSIVAREYGIPGVLNVMVGTKLIKTGQIITVDGAKGEVYLHEE